MSNGKHILHLRDASGEWGPATEYASKEAAVEAMEQAARPEWARPTWRRC